MLWNLFLTFLDSGLTERDDSVNSNLAKQKLLQIEGRKNAFSKLYSLWQETPKLCVEPYRAMMLVFPMHLAEHFVRRTDKRTDV